MKPSLQLLALTLATGSVLVQPAFAAISIDSVLVENIGNANDSTGFGGVGYGYRIGTYEVSVSQYSAFLNAVAKTDTYGLYNANMATDLNIAGITRSGISGTFSYSVLGSPTKPVTWVTWFDSARFANWLQNGQPNGAQAAGTTETGTYALNGALSGLGFTRNPLAQYVLPTENEWYKAAYHQPGADSDDYWLYPTANNAVPNSRNGSLSDPNSGNLFRDDGLANGFNGGYAVNNSTTSPSGNALTDGGAFSLAESYYGTFDQAGNVFEWSEAVIGSNRGVRGGSWSVNETFARSTSRNSFFPQNDNSTTGFRVVIIPEPGVVGLMMTLGIVLMAWRRKRTS